MAPPLVGRAGCFPGVYEGCDVSACSCSCGVSADCGPIAYCLPADEHPVEDDCPIASLGCDGLPGFIDNLGFWLSDGAAGAPTDLESALQECALKAQRALNRCTGAGGESGTGSN